MAKLSSARHGIKKKMLRNFKCKKCSKTYAMEWAKQNHERLCIQRDW